MARKKETLHYSFIPDKDFLNFKTMAKLLRILSIREDDQDNSVSKPDLREVMVKENYLVRYFSR